MLCCVYVLFVNKLSLGSVLQIPKKIEFLCVWLRNSCFVWPSVHFRTRKPCVPTVICLHRIPLPLKPACFCHSVTHACLSSWRLGMTSASTGIVHESKCFVLLYWSHFTGLDSTTAHSQNSTFLKNVNR